MQFTHLHSNLDILGGKMCIKGTRISVDVLLEWLSNGATRDEILHNYPQISEEAISEALRYASELSKNTIDFEIKISPAA